VRVGRAHDVQAMLMGRGTVEVEVEVEVMAMTSASMPTERGQQLPCTPQT
jgi:hypothetical protein